jgi:hypothetical protein
LAIWGSEILASGVSEVLISQGSDVQGFWRSSGILDFVLVLGFWGSGVPDSVVLGIWSFGILGWNSESLRFCGFGIQGFLGFWGFVASGIMVEPLGF